MSPRCSTSLVSPTVSATQFTTYGGQAEGFSKSEAAGWETGGQTGLGKDISVILVMNEAFSDLTDQSMFNWTEETGPLPHLHALQKAPTPFPVTSWFPALPEAPLTRSSMR